MTKNQTEKHSHYNLYLIVGLLFLVVVFLWLYLGGWKKQFNLYQIKKEEPKKNLLTDLPNLWQKSDDQFNSLFPEANSKKETKELLTEALVDRALEKATDFNGLNFRYPDKWALIQNNASSTLKLIAPDGENFFVENVELLAGNDPVATWHNYKNEPVLGWSWIKVGDGFIGNKRNEQTAKSVGLYPSATSSILIIERQSTTLEKNQDGMIETIILGLRKKTE